MSLSIQFKNFASTTVASPVIAGDTTIVITSATNWPALSGSQYCYAVLADSLTAPTTREIVKVTARTGTALTVVRAQEGTSAQSWNTGSFIELRWTAGSIADVHDQTVTDARTDTGDLTLTADSDNNGAGNLIRKVGVTTINTAYARYDLYSVPISQPREISVAAYGAIGDYNPVTGTGTDDSAAIQAALDAAYTAKGGVVILENKIYKLGSALNVPMGVVLKGTNPKPSDGFMGHGSGAWVPGGVDPETGGSGWAAGGRKFRNMQSSLWVTFDAGKGDGTPTYDVQPSHSIPNYSTRTAAIYVAGELRDLNLFQYSYDNGKNAGYTDTATWNSAWNSGYMASLAVRLTADDSKVMNCLIGGFMQAILACDLNRPVVDNVYIDCINGVECVLVYDRGYINRVHAYLYCGYTNSNTSLVRRADFVYMHDTVDWVTVTNCLTYGHKWGYYLSNIGECSFVDCAADNTALETAGYYGAYVAANCQDTTFIDFRAANREYGFYSDASAGNQVAAIGSNLLSVDKGYYINTGDATIVGGKVRGDGANKIAVTNASATGDVTVINLTMDTITTQFSGNVSYFGDAGRAKLRGTSPQLYLEDMTYDRAAILYTDAALDVILEAFQQSNTVNKKNLYLQKYGGDLLVGTGVIKATGGQIEFPATDNPSSNANTLDDYQETDFTPALAGSGTAGTQTYSTQSGKATKIGRQVTATFNIVLTAKDAGTAGDLRITGFPFTAGGSVTYSAAIGKTTNLDLNVGGGYYSVGAFMDSGNTYLTLHELGDNIGSVPLTAADFNATTAISGTITYFV